MKNLLTKTLFVSLLFSAVAPAIQANGTTESAKRYSAYILVAAVTLAAHKAYSVGSFGRAKESVRDAWTNNKYYVRDVTKVGAGIAIGLIPGLYLVHQLSSAFRHW